LPEFLLKSFNECNSVLSALAVKHLSVELLFSREFYARDSDKPAIANFSDLVRDFCFHLIVSSKAAASQIAANAKLQALMISVGSANIANTARQQPIMASVCHITMVVFIMHLLRC
jgi:hypothetical protein